ncbi:ABC transporter substrate-binding protein [Danxiaibacter flavus]|uniref:ABC transporter substrate-binding protein n=1 Tax=Danxiaibacter flavus TaxID=3049108 RepID=A0ABV3ZDZ4_9BACT|nr:ABC transporter substrate-binding protein [Chitinophagaceae bacterium DXS]
MAEKFYRNGVRSYAYHNKWSIFGYLMIVFVCACISCNSGRTENKQVFIYNEVTGIATLDPAFAKNQSVMWAVHQLYNTLIEVDENMKIAPSLATRWEISDDRLTYTFHLRTDVYFQDNDAFPNGKGRKMTATDIAYSLQRIRDAKTASSGAWIFNNRVAEDGFVAVDDSTFKVKLIRPFQPILGILSMQYCSIIAREAVEKYGPDYRRHPCGTGPFQLSLWEEGQAMILQKNPHYWEKDTNGAALPYLDAVKISFFDNKATEFLLFRQGQLSFINDIDPSFKDEVLTKKGELRKEWQGKIVLQKHEYLNTEYFGILVDDKSNLLANSPVKIKAVRQAMNYAVDKRKLVMYLRNSIGLPAESGIVPDGFPSQNVQMVKGYTYDPSKAAALLKAAGFDKGQGLPPVKLLTIPIYEDIASFCAKQMEEVGLKVQVEVVQKALLLEQTAKSQALFFRASWMADYPDAENYMTMFYSKNPAPPNYTRYKNPAFDVLYEKALQETNDSLRYALYRQMDQMVINDAPVMPIFYDEVIHLVNNHVENMHANALNLLELRKVKIK